MALAREKKVKMGYAGGSMDGPGPLPSGLDLMSG
jgi:hypothetical protein